MLNLASATSNAGGVGGLFKVWSGKLGFRLGRAIILALGQQSYLNNFMFSCSEWEASHPDDVFLSTGLAV